MLPVRRGEGGEGGRFKEGLRGVPDRAQKWEYHVGMKDAKRTWEKTDPKIGHATLGGKSVSSKKLWRRKKAPRTSRTRK